MTEDEEQVLEFIEVYKKQNKYLPNVREIATWLDNSVGQAHRILTAHPHLQRIQIGHDTWRYDIDPLYYSGPPEDSSNLEGDYLSRDRPARPRSDRRSTD